MTGEHKLYTIVQEMVPFDVFVLRRVGEGHDWYRIPSWKVTFDAVPLLAGFELRIHKSIQPTGWTLSEASTGCIVCEVDDEDCTSGGLLDYFCEFVLPRLSREMMIDAVDKARQSLAVLPPCPWAAGTLQ